MKSDLITVTGHRSKMSIELVEEEGTHHSPIISNKRKSRINRLLIVLIIQSIGLIGLDHLRKSKGPFSDETLRCDQPKRIVFVTIYESWIEATYGLINNFLRAPKSY